MVSWDDVGVVSATSILRIIVLDGDSPTTGNGLVDVSIEEGGLGKFVVVPVEFEPSSRIILADINTTSDAVFDLDVQSEYNIVVSVRSFPPSCGQLISY